MKIWFAASFGFKFIPLNPLLIKELKTSKSFRRKLTSRAYASELGKPFFTRKETKRINRKPFSTYYAIFLIHGSYQRGLQLQIPCKFPMWDVEIPTLPHARLDHS